METVPKTFAQFSETYYAYGKPDSPREIQKLEKGRKEGKQVEKDLRDLNSYAL